MPENTLFSWTLPSQSAPNFPTCVIVGFQSGKLNDQTKNPALFDHCRINTCHLVVNERSYPEVPYKMSFTKYQYARVYRDVASFKEQHYGIKDLVSDSCLTAAEYGDFNTIFVFYIENREEFLKVTTVDLILEAEFDVNPHASTQAYALVTSDCICKLKSDGSSLSLVK